MSRKLLAILVLSVLLATASPTQFHSAEGDSTIPVVNRVFYLTSQTTLSLQRPGPGVPSSENVSGTRIEFVHLPVIQVPTVAVSSRWNLSLWITSDRNSTVTLTGTLEEKLPGNTVPLVNSTITQPVNLGTQAYSFPFSVTPSNLAWYSQLAVVVKITWPANADLTWYWGADPRLSFATIPLSGFQTVSSSPEIRDHSGALTTSFDLNARFPNNTIYFQVSVASAFGLSDVQRVNMSIVDNNQHIVRNTDQQMFPGGLGTSRPETYTGLWNYPANATEGVYQLRVDIIDIQNSTSFRYRGSATFQLQRPNLFTTSLNYLPYFGGSGVAIAGAALYYRRRKTRKSYLVPFEYFNTLTGGELSGGSVISVEGNTGAGKTLLAEQYMFEDLKQGKPCVFVSTGDFPLNIRTNMKAMGMDISGHEQRGLVTFVDGYSSEAGQESREKFSIPSLGDLTTLGIKISSSLPQQSFKGGSLYFDSLTPLASKTRPENLVSFVQSLGARVKGMGGKAFFTVGPSVDGVVQRQLEEMADCVVQMEAFEAGGVRKSRLRIAKLRARKYQQGWTDYTIEDGKGIIFYSKKPRS